jgi:hypothetical protein
MSKQIGLSEPFIFGQEYKYIKECLLPSSISLTSEELERIKKVING